MDHKSAINISLLSIIFGVTLNAGISEQLEQFKDRHLALIDQLSSSSSQQVSMPRMIVKNGETAGGGKETPQKPTQEPAKAPEEPKYYNYTKQAVWGDVQVNLTAIGNKFSVNVKSSAPIVYMKLIDIIGVLYAEKTIGKYGEDSGTLTANTAYIPAFKLQLDVRANGAVNTITVPLYNKFSGVTK